MQNIFFNENLLKLFRFSFICACMWCKIYGPKRGALLRYENNYNTFFLNY